MPRSRARPDSACNDRSIGGELGYVAIDDFRGGNERSFDIAPDGERFILIKRGAVREDGDTSDAQRRIVIVQNWFGGLDRPVSTR